MSRLSKNFYLFLGCHSFLLGLFPFFLTVYLFKNGTTLAEISWFIALTGVGFSLTLWILDHVRSGSCLVPVVLFVYPGRVIVDFSVLLLTIVVGCMGTGVFLRYGRGLQFPLAMQQQKALNLRAIAGFTDSYNSKLIFAIDGIFLYLESYFWLISLFLVVGESFVRLGVLVIVLAIILGSLFFAIKNRIDCLDKQKVYISSVLLL